jgi:Protein of unknown function (DUF3501)
VQKLRLQDIWPNKVYETARPEMQAKVIALKTDRRLHLTDEVTLVFENRETLRFQVQEMLRVEGITSPEGIQAELDVYNALMPNPRALSATLFIEITEEARIPEVLHRLVGIEEAISLRFAGHGVLASFEPGHSDGQRISAVQYIRFNFDDRARNAFLEAGRVEIVIEHAAAHGRVQLSAPMLKSLQSDLLAE